MSDTDEQSTMRRDALAVGVAAVVAVVLGANLFLLFDDGDDEQLAGNPAPAFELPVMNSDRTRALEDFRGQVVVVDFWATWCDPCRDQMPILDRLADDSELGDQMEIFSVNTDIDDGDRIERIERFVEREEVELPVLLGDGEVLAAYRVDSIPTLVVVDPEGNISSIDQGVYDEQRLRELIDRADRGG